jgi:pimeloyl-ACP methyl ester carboxylesterase
MFEQQSEPTSDESYVDDFTDNQMNIKYANFASEAYVAPNDRQMNLLGYTYNSKYSDKNLSTYVDKPDKKIVISIRGTVPTDYQDIVSDIGIVSADKSFNITRLSNHKKMINEIIDKYPGYKLILSGHSLGAYLVEQLAETYPDAQAIVFNPGTSLSESNLSNPQSNVIGYRTKGDPVSAGYSSIPMKTLRSKSRFIAGTQSYFNMLLYDLFSVRRSTCQGNRADCYFHFSQ